MKRFVRKVVTITHRHLHDQPNLSFNHSHRIFHHTSCGSAHIHTPKSTQLGHPCHRFHSPYHTRSCLSQPVIALSSRNALRRISLLDCRPRLPALHFSAQRFNSSRSYGSYGRRGWRSWFDTLTPDIMVLGLIIANTAVFWLWRIADEKFMINNFTISLDNIKSGRLHTLVTNAFSHVDSIHIITYMLILYFSGTNVERNLGPGFLLKLYLAGAIGGSVFYLVHQAYKAQSSKGWRFTNHSKDLALLANDYGASGPANAVMLVQTLLFPPAFIFHDFFRPVSAILLGVVGVFLIGKGKDMRRNLEEDPSFTISTYFGGGAAGGAIALALVRKGRF